MDKSLCLHFLHIYICLFILIINGFFFAFWSLIFIPALIIKLFFLFFWSSQVMLERFMDRVRSVLHALTCAL